VKDSRCTTWHYSFGAIRITARLRRKAGLKSSAKTNSRKIHEKAVLILTNYLGRRFARKAPISLTASITFEQLYG